LSSEQPGVDWLGVAGKRYLVFGVANRKSVGWAIARTLEEAGAEVIFSVRSEARRESLEKLLSGREVHVCDVERKEAIETLAERLGKLGANGKSSAVDDPGGADGRANSCDVEEPSPRTIAARESPRLLDGIVHAIAFANYSKGWVPFHDTEREDFLQATAISAFSLVDIARAFKPLLAADASVVAISISSQVTAENYGYMAPVKAALDSCSRFLAKSFSQDSRVRFNTVNAGPLKTSASAGIPGYLESYLYAEKMTMRKEALKTQEVANTAVYLLSPRSSGINAQSLVVNAGMDLNYFDKELIETVMRSR
jgi:enoyl-[acyl-carrier protein] reductase I